MPPDDRIQWVIALPFKQDPEDHPRVRALLGRGWRVVQLQRTSDHEAVVTLSPPEVAAGEA